jgi:hypothetical protein
MSIRKVSLYVVSVALLAIYVQPVSAKDSNGYLRLNVKPAQAYIYADGVPYVESQRHFITLTPGEHKIDLYNYGYRPETRNVTIVAGKLWVENVTMEAIPGMITGPWGCITIKGADRAAVLLNGKDPAAFLVGHGDEFNNELGWHQELIVPPGKQELTLEYAHGDPWSVTVDVQPNKRVVVDAYKGVRETVDWSRGEQYSELPRFHAGIASARVVVEKVTGVFAAATGQVNCGDSTQLTWSSTGAAKMELNGTPVSASGDQTVQPKQTTDYKFTAAGPGGVYTSDATVRVNADIPASLHVSPTDANVDHQSTATVTWSAPNADSVTLDPVGPVAGSGSQEIPITPTKNVAGPIDQDITYTLHATNACGGDVTRTASLHLTGSNGAPQEAAAPPPEAPAESTQVAEAAPPPAQLPQTASQLPLAGLIGTLFLAAAASLRIILKISA